MAYGSRRNRDSGRDRGDRGDGRGERRDSDRDMRRRGGGDSRRSSERVPSRRERDSQREPSAGPRSSYSRRPAPSGPPPVPADLADRLDQDPIFQVLTHDQQHWIDPFSGEPVAVGQVGYREAALNHWQSTGSWQTGKQLGIEQIQAVRWRQDLMRLLPKERRLRLFGTGAEGWLNPYSGDWEPAIQRDDGRISMRTVNAMASVLARCPYAQAGVMLDPETLRQRQQGGAGYNTEDQYASNILNGIEDDLQRAKDVQKNMLSNLIAIPGYDLGVHYTPHSGVSGDFYETMPLPDGRIFLLLGDVSGHGMQAALVVATALKTLRMLARSTSDLVQLMGQLNDEIKADLLPGQFITAFAGVLDPVRHELTSVLAGHHQLLLANERSEVMLRKVGLPGMAIGLVAGDLFRKSLRPEMIPLEPGDLAVQYSDGLVESINESGAEYGLARFGASVLRYSEDGAQSMSDTVAANVQAYASGEVDDDLTVLALRRHANER
ncbi:MAG: PP2C family protein-serine/threonine phosphatase [Planctomycetota bacterium]|jgi:serine phosphatase RsbU (regulator of sigma subunit)|nr:PP2C family protein-serine/threonine phosphatase [Planctomycetota bacterium]